MEGKPECTAFLSLVPIYQGDQEENQKTIHTQQGQKYNFFFNKNISSNLPYSPKHTNQTEAEKLKH